MRLRDETHVHRSHELRRILREFTCEYCNAPPRRLCVTSKGDPCWWEHASRYDQAVAAGRLPAESTPLRERPPDA
jgi:hypothetical protein